MPETIEINSGQDAPFWRGPAWSNGLFTRRRFSPQPGFISRSLSLRPSISEEGIIMKNQVKHLLIALALCSTLNLQPSTAFAQGTAFTYQGQLQNNGGLASGTYNLTFSLFANNVGGTAVAGPVTNNAVIITNGLFTVLIDFGSGVWNGATNWLVIGVATNGTSSFTTLSPRQQLTPTPYAIYAESVAASGIIGTLLDTQLLHDAVTVTAGPGFSGGGKVTLGNSIILTNTGVLSVTGNADITATPVSGAVTLGDTATSADTANLIVKRDGSGNFSAATITLDGNLNLPGTTATAGIIYAGGLPLINAFGPQNFFAGPDAGNQTMSGARNTANGYVALLSNTSGYDNTANGAYALLLNTSGFDNTASGSQALYYNTNGAANTADGYQALYYDTSGFANTAVGWQALYSNTGDNSTHGSYNTASGAHALYANTLGNDNTANGYEALYSNIGDALGDGCFNTASGFEALYSNTNGYANTANGEGALYSNTSGILNTANGAVALVNNTTGNNNTANGAYALYSNLSGSGNTANGYHALYLNTSGADNTANGRAALYNNTGGIENTADGVQALNSNTNGTENTAVGYQAMFSNTGFFVAGSDNTAIGWQALYGNTSGYNNIALGAQAGYSITTGSDNIDIFDGGTASDAGVIRIGTPGYQTQTFIAGISGVTAASGVAVYVNSSGQLGTLTSSRRFKEDIQGMGDASDVLYALKPVTFKYKPGIDPQGIPQFGLVAEEVAKVDPDLVVRDDQGKIYTVRYQAVDAMLLNEFLKEHRTVEEQSTEIEILKTKAAKVDSLEKRLNELEKAVARVAEKSGTTFALNSRATEDK
jgi:trimeric autotransporter adhesin